MQISEIHSLMYDEIRAQGRLTNPSTGIRLRQNRGVKRAWRKAARELAEYRNSHTPHVRTKAHRLGRCGCFLPSQ